MGTWADLYISCRCVNTHCFSARSKLASHLFLGEFKYLLYNSHDRVYMLLLFKTLHRCSWLTTCLLENCIRREIGRACRQNQHLLLSMVNSNICLITLTTEYIHAFTFQNFAQMFLADLIIPVFTKGRECQITQCFCQTWSSFQFKTAT